MPGFYSGEASVEFWDRVRKVNKVCREVYTMGCILQDVEARVLYALQEAEDKLRVKPRRRKKEPGR